MNDKKHVIKRPPPLPVVETEYGFLCVKYTKKTSDGRVLEVKKTPLWDLWRETK